MQIYAHFLLFITLFVHCLTDTPDIHNWTLTAPKCGGRENTLTLIDISKECIHRAKMLYPNCVEDEENCRKKEKSLAFLDVAMNVMSEVKKKLPYLESTQGSEPEFTTSVERPMECHGCPKNIERPMDCSDILRSGKGASGVYTIWPNRRIFSNKSLSVYCDMDTDGGGWTVIQRRGNFSSPKDYFYKNWKSYKNGFGNLTEEFWIGNDNIHVISTQAFINRPYHIRFDLKDAEGNEGYAEYSNFWIENEAARYTLHIEGYKGTAGDSMTYHNKMKFTTRDSDNDERSDGSCAVFSQGAWWYKKCENSNLNGLYQPGIINATGNFWYHWKLLEKGLSAVEIKLRS